MGDDRPSREQAFGCPVASVIIPSYNRARLLPRAITSALAQTCADLEVVVVDDGSMDGTEHVVRAISDPRLRYVRLATNRGEASATNVGIRQAQGAFVAFLDSDDVWYPTKIERQLEVFASAPGDAVFTDVLEQASSGRQTRLRPFDPPASFGVTSGLFRKAALERVGLLDESLPLCCDDELGMRLSQRCQVRQIKEILMVRHRSADAKSMSPRAEEWRYASYQRIYQKHLPFLTRRFGRGYVGRQFYGWGVWELRRGDHRVARRWFWQATMTAPFQLRNSVKLAMACVPWWAAQWRRRRRLR